VHRPTVLGEALEDAFAWLGFLEAAERRLFVDEFTRVIIAAAALDSYAPLSQLVREWRATAEAQADPTLARRLRRPIAAAGKAVPAPHG